MTPTAPPARSSRPRRATTSTRTWTRTTTTARLRQQPGRRRRARLRLPDRPQRARADLPRGARREPVLREQHDPRRPAPLRVRRGVGQLPGQQLRPRRHGQRLRPRRGGRRQRHQQRQLLHPGAPTAAAADADVPVAGQPVRRARTRSSSTASARSTPRGRASGRRPTAPGSPGHASVYAGNGLHAPPTTRPRCPTATGSRSSTAAPRALPVPDARRRSPVARRRRRSWSPTTRPAPRRCSPAR